MPSVWLRCDDGAHHGLAVRVAVEPVDEGLVDLDDVEREGAQAGEGRVAGAEVVDGQSDAEGLQLAKQRAARIEVLDERALGDLDQQRAGGEPGRVEGVDDVVDHAVVVEVAGREVDADVEVVVDEPCLLPVAGLPARFVEDPAAERDDEPGASRRSG